MTEHKVLGMDRVIDILARMRRLFMLHFGEIDKQEHVQNFPISSQASDVPLWNCRFGSRIVIRHSDNTELQPFADKKSG